MSRRPEAAESSGETRAGSSLLGSLARRVTRWLVTGYYPRIEVTGAERIPPAGPVLLCGNHPNSLLDPVLIGIACRRPVHFLAKAPLFKTPVLGPVMYALGMIPTYRGGDDARQVRRNVESLESGSQVLVQGQAVGIFPEGKSHDEAQLEMVRSGAARIAVAAVEAGAKGLAIVPLGLHYQRKEQFRSAVWVAVGEPIDVATWLEEQDEQGRKALRELTRELEQRLKAVVLHLEQPGWEPLLDDIESLVQGDTRAGSLILRKQIADAINHFLATDRRRAETVAAEMKAHREAVRAHGMTLKSPILRAGGVRLVPGLIGRILTFLFLLPPAILGLTFHLIPFAVVRLVASRLQPPGRTAISFYRLLVGLPVYACWYAAAVLLGAWMSVPAPLIAICLLVMPFIGVIALDFWPRARQTASGFWRHLLVLLQPARRRHLGLKQDSLRSQLVKMAEEYALSR